MKTNAKTEVKILTQVKWVNKLILLVLISVIEVFNIRAQYSGLHEMPLDSTMSTPFYAKFATDGNAIYGMTAYGGTNNYGVIFKMNKDGTGFQKLLDFDGASKGAYPKGSLILAGSVLYGMTTEGGTNHCGVIFRVNTDGTGYQKLLDFDGTSRGANPYGALIISGSTLYGTTYQGGANNYGVVFRIKTDGTNFLKLLDFDGTSKGANPNGSLIISGSSLYGMTVNGGSYSKGVIFKINTDGSGFSRLRNFNGTERGAHPYGALTLSGTKLYGMTQSGGANNLGCIFSINTDGTGHTRLLDFDGANNGANPTGTLFLSGTVLYGVTPYGGVANNGCVFSINTDGTNFWRKWNLGATGWGGYENNGMNPYGSVILIGNEIIGMTYQGGHRNAGTIFRVYDYSIGSSDGVYRKLRDCHPAYQGDHLTGDFTTDGTVLYGTAWDGGANNKGSIFKVNKDGTSFQNIYHFNTDLNGYSPVSVIMSGTTLYGMTHDGGAYNAGTIFKINADGSGFQKIFDFNITGTGNTPYGKFILIGSTLYATTATGGSKNSGTVFKINTDGSGYQSLVEFEGSTNGSYPGGSLTLVGSALYGTTLRGGANNLGVIFKVNTDGTGFQKLLDFDGTSTGANPRGGSLTLVGTALYGMTENGGTNKMGVMFKINTDGTEFQKLLDFERINNGAKPAYASLTSFNSALYGNTPAGGTFGRGVIFKINPDGSNFEKIYDFDSISGATPSNSLLFINSTMYGTTFSGGSDEIGVIYKYNLNNFQIDATGGTLTCITPTININVTSTVTGVTYAWSGPNGFTSTNQNPEVTSPGDYIVTVTYGSESLTDTAKVTQDITVPGAASAGGNITCTSTSVTLSGSSSTLGVTYSWSGPNSFTSSLQNPPVNNIGIYLLTVTNPINGCTSIDSATVSSDTTTPGAFASVLDTLNCIINTVSLSANSLTTGVGFEWTGPDNYHSTEQNAVTNIAGEYTVTVINSVNGCRSSAPVTVVEDTLKPGGVTATVPDTLSCSSTAVMLTGTSTTSNVSFDWTGPNGFTSTGEHQLVTHPGTYALTVQNLVNGCIDIANVNVLIDTVPPTSVTATVGGNLTCDVGSIFLTGTASPSTGISYSWAGPEGFTSALQNPEVTMAGKYILTATLNSTGCSTKDSVTVARDTDPPADITAEVTDTLDCNTAAVILIGSSSNPDAMYSWIGPGDFSSPDAITFTNLAGEYTLTATNPMNGCSDNTTVMVILDDAVPVCNIIEPTSSPAALDTNVISVVQVSDVSYSWNITSDNTNWAILSGADNPELTYRAGDAGTSGTIVLIVTNNGNGCSSECRVDLTAVSTIKSSPILLVDTGNSAPDMKVLVYPNPFSDKAIIEFIPVNDGHTTIELYTNQGIFVSKLFDEETLKAQSYKVLVNGETLMTGAYYCVIMTNSKRYIYKLILIK